MGSIQSKNNPSEKEVKGLRKKVRLLEKEIMSMREKESQAYEREMMGYAYKEAEWKRERKRLREEVKKLRKRVEEREERIRGMEDEKAVLGERSERDKWEWQLLGTTSFMVEQMREERFRRDEAVEKWKKLYLAIKTELDELIQRTHQGERLCWRAEEEDLMEELQQELKSKEETIALLQARVASMEQEKTKREREVDILRQSLRIMTHKKSQQVLPKSSQEKTKREREVDILRQSLRIMTHKKSQQVLPKSSQEEYIC